MILLSVMPVCAAENTSWVVDEPNVLSQDTVDYISNLDENIFPTYQNKPQLAVVIVDSLPSGESADEYATELFNQYGVGTEEENCGLLFLLSVSDRKYALEVGNGYQDGSGVKNALQQDPVTDDIKTLLQNEDYDGATMAVVEELEDIMANEENGLYNTTAEEGNSEAFDWTGITNDIQPLSDEDKASLVIGGVIILILIGGFFIANITGIIFRNKKKKQILDDNVIYLRLISRDTSEIENKIMQDDFTVTEDSVRHKIYKEYVSAQLDKIEKLPHTEGDKAYSDYFEECNTFEKFIAKDLLPIEQIIREVDNKAAELKRIREINIKNIEAYIETLDMHSSVISKESLRNKAHNCQEAAIDNELSNVEIKDIVTHMIESLEFDADYEKFIKQNKDKTNNRYFDKKALRQEILEDSAFRHRGNDIFLDHRFMLLLLSDHITKNRTAEERRIAKEEADAVYYEHQHSSSFDGFGGSFGGGFSNGGGPSGGW